MTCSFEDLNPIQHMWNELGRRIRSLPNPPTTPAELGIALQLQQERQNIPRRTVRNLCQSMRTRLEAVLRNNGGHNRY